MQIKQKVGQDQRFFLYFTNYSFPFATFCMWWRAKEKIPDL